MDAAPIVPQLCRRNGRIAYRLSKETVGLVIAAFVVAVPLAYLLTSRWLETFAYRVGVTADVYAAAGLIVLLLAVSTVSYQATRAATMDPVRSLRDE